MREPDVGQLQVLRTDPDGSPGVAKTIKRCGTGSRPTNGMKVGVKYMGMLSDGTVFDSTGGNKRHFTLGMREMHGLGCDVGIASMKVGERCMLTCSPAYTYGDQGAPPKIPAGTSLNFDIELLHAEVPTLLRSVLPSVLGAIAFVIAVGIFFQWEFHR